MDNKYIPLTECIKGHLYRIRSRNLTMGVYNGDEGFVGIREKFGSKYLFTEYHWDQGPPFGTAMPIEDLGLIPPNIEIYEWCVEKDKPLSQTSVAQNEKLFEYLERRSK